MNVADVIRLVSHNTSANAGRLESVATELRRLDLLPAGGRGPWAPKINRVQAAALLTTWAAVERVNEVPDVVINLSRLVDERGERFLSFVASLLISEEHNKWNVREITIFPGGNIADIGFGEGEAKKNIVRFMPPETWAVKAPAYSQQQSFGGRVGHVGGGLLGMIALDFDGAAKGMIVPE